MHGSPVGIRSEMHALKLQLECVHGLPVGMCTVILLE